MRTAQVNGEKIVIKEVENLTLNGQKGAIVKVLGCGLCGSDIVKFKHGIVKDGAVLGHEIVAIIEEIDSETSFKKGDKIVSSHHIPCFKCTYCQHGNFSMCSHFKETNIFPGGFSEKVYLSEEHLKNVAHLIPNCITEEEISFYEPLGCCVRAIKRCNLQQGDKVLVVGLGSIGLIMAQAIQAMGYEVYACDILEDRIELANNKGIKSYSSREMETFEKIISEKTQKHGVDAVFMTSGADKAIEVALKTIKMGGKILVFSSTPNNMGYANNEIYYKELTIMGSYSPSPKDLEESFELLVSKKVDVKNLTTNYSLEKIQEAFEDTMSNKIFKAYIKI
jgi:L-iditol 2-dehydrogenase